MLLIYSFISTSTISNSLRLLFHFRVLYILQRTLVGQVEVFLERCTQLAKFARYVWCCRIPRRICCTRLESRRVCRVRSHLLCLQLEGRAQFACLVLSRPEGIWGAPSPPWRHPLKPPFASERVCKPGESFPLEPALQIVNVCSDHHSLMSELR